MAHCNTVLSQMLKLAVLCIDLLIAFMTFQSKIAMQLKGLVIKGVGAL